MESYTQHAALAGRLVIIGFGSIGQGVLPLILRHIGIDRSRISVIAADDDGAGVVREYGVTLRVEPLTPDNYRSILGPMLSAGDFLLNLSVEVSSIDLVGLALEKGALYLDTCIEPWPGGYTDPRRSVSERSNYGYREKALSLRKAHAGSGTKVLAHGANPGLVSHFVKRALLDIARDTGVTLPRPSSRDEWAALSHRLGIKVIHVAERDTQVANQPRLRGEFVNTWSIDGFVAEGCQPAELGWGTHEKELPKDGMRHPFGCDAAIYLNRPGAATKVRTWTPLEGPFHGFLITHNEAISIADYLTHREGARTVYRPTVHYAYHPCDDAVVSIHEFAGKNWEIQPAKRLMMDEIVSGVDELGVLLMGHAKTAYWYGSRLSIEMARGLAPHNNATSLQVTAAVMAGMIWALENPRAGIVEADELDHERVLDLAGPYLGDLVGVYGDWTPLVGRGTLFPEDIDSVDPWQFGNFRVM